jgi:hypothetical protein
VAGTPERLAIGASNFHLRSDGTAPVWSPESASLTNPMDAVGDLIRGGTAGAPTKLAIGASNFVLKSSGTIPEWSNTLRLSYIDLDEHTLGLPPSPPAGAIRLYGSNSKGYYENSSGTVVELGGAGGGGGISGVAVEEDGVEEGATITRFDFTTGLNVSVTGSEATISATGGGSGDTVVGNVLVVYPEPVQTLMPTDGSNNFSPTGSAAWLYPIHIPGKMYVRSLLFRVETGNTGSFQWGLFYTGSDATAATKVAGGSGALNATGWVAIAADSAPVLIDAGAYMLIFHVPAANRPTLKYTDHLGTSPFRLKAQLSYTWDDTPNLTSGWTHDSGSYIIALKGDLDASNQW